MSRHSLAGSDLARCQSGVAALEFALIMPVFILLMMGIIEMSMIMFTSAVMESATTNTSRTGKTGYVAAGKTRQQQIVDIVKARTAGLLDGNKITVSTSVYANLNQVDKPEPCLRPATPPCGGTPGYNFTDINGNGQWDSDMGQAGLGNPGDIVVYTVSYPWKLLTPIVGALFGNNGTIELQARSVVKNEPYDD